MFSKFFIDRPIFATVLALLIVVAGLVTLGILPIAQYPDITPPTVQVSAVYPGANAQTVAQTVGIPIEQQVNGVDGMLYMSSNSSSSGAYSLTITFAVGTDIDMATVQVQNRVSVAQSSLPTPVVVQGVTVQKQSSNIVMFLTMTSDSKDYDGLYLSNYAKLNLVDQLTRVPGVGAVNVMGAGDYSMRIWLDPAAMRIRYLSPADVYQAIQSQNVEVSAGNVGQPIGTDNKNAYQYSLTVKGRLTSPEEFGNIILRTETGGKILRLRDVAHIDLGSASYSVVSQLDGKPTAAIAIYQQPGSNSLDVSKGVKAKMQELSQNFPAGIQYNVTLDTTDVIHASIDEVMVTFLETTLLVVLVIFLFLQNWRAVVIPCITIPVSLIGTLAVMSLFGFSINTLTLFGLILAVAIVVDDAIVVVENSTRLLDTGRYTSRQAVTEAMGEITGPIVGVVLVLLAVFIPTTLVSGISGQLYKQFALTIAASTVLSGFNSLTLTPALCALMLQPTRPSKNPLYRGFNHLYDKTQGVYDRIVEYLLQRPVASIVSYAVFTLIAVLLFVKWPSTFVPEEDDGYFLAVVQLPPASSLERTQAVGKQINKILDSYPEIKDYIGISGFSVMGGGEQSNAATYFIVLKTGMNARERNIRLKRSTALQYGSIWHPGSRDICHGPACHPRTGSYRRPATPIGRPPQPRRHRDAACCRDLDGALPQLSGTGIGQQPVPSQCTAIFFEYRPRQGTVDGYPAEQCIHRLGLLYGGGLRQRLCTVRTHLPSEIGGGRPCPACHRRCSEIERSQCIGRNGTFLFLHPGGRAVRHGPDKQI